MSVIFFVMLVLGLLGTVFGHIGTSTLSLAFDSP